MKLPDAQVTRIAKALADPQRLEILQRVAKTGNLTCSEVTSKCPIGQATVSHHLRELVNAGLVARRKEGQYAYFTFEAEVFEAYLQELQKRLARAGASMNP
jgi:ArsR family transcriptional regulator